MCAVIIILKTVVLLTVPPYSFCQAQTSVLKGPYLGQAPPGCTPEVFAPGFFERGNVVGCTFSADGREFYFCRFISKSPRIMVSLHGESGWTKPVLTDFNKAYFGGPPFISPAGNKLVWRTSRPFPDNWRGVKPRQGSREAVVYWHMNKTESGWTAPVPLVLPVPDPSGLHGISMTLDGTLYTSYGGIIARIARRDDSFAVPEKVLSGFPGAYPAVAPDESFLVLVKQGRPRSLMVSFRKSNGTWRAPRSLGEEVNQPGMNGYPYLSPDGKYLFYTLNHKIYWVSIEILNELR